MQHNGNIGRWIAEAATVGSAAVLLAASMSGCVQSDTITEKVLDNNKTSQVDKNIQPQLINDINAKKTSEELPQLVNDPKSKKSSKNTKKIPVYTSNKRKATTKKPAPRPKYKTSATSAGQASKSMVKDNKAKTEQKHGDTKKKKSKNGAKKKLSKTGRQTKQKSSKKRSVGTKSTSSGKPGTGNGTGATFTSDIDKDPKIPSNINEVAAVGNNAVIVSMVAGSSGSTPLKACDANTKKQTASVLRAKGISKAAALWSGDGSVSGSLSSANFKKLLKKGTIPDLVFVTENSDTLSKAQIKTLRKRKVDVYYLPALTSSKRIRYAVKVVGLILDKGGVSGAKSNSQKYLDWEDRLVNKYSKGKFAGGYNFDSEDKAADLDDHKVTLYIDDWDDGARYKESGLSSSSGVALSTLGYSSAPISYYLSAGGVLNNAASKTFRRAQDGEEGIVWQFATTTAPAEPSEWSNLSATDYNLQDAINKTGNTFRNDLLCYTDPSNSSDYCGYGTDSFDSVIVKSKNIGKLFKASAKSSKGLYRAYPASGGTPAARIGGKRVSACVGNDGTRAVSNVSKNMKVLVNPKGFAQSKASDALCSWTDGSVESPLETSWASYQFSGGSKSDFENDVKDFYSTFYGYDLSDGDLSKIESGVSK